MILDKDASIYKGVIYEINRRDCDRDDLIEYCIFSDANVGDPTRSGALLDKLKVDRYLLVKFVNTGGGLYECSMPKSVIYNSRERFQKSSNRKLLKAMLRGRTGLSRERALEKLRLFYN